MSSIYHNLKSDKQYKAGSGLNKTQFEQIFKAFDKLYFPKIGNPYVKDKAPVLTDKKEALFFILHYYKSYRSGEPSNVTKYGTLFWVL